MRRLILPVMVALAGLASGCARLSQYRDATSDMDQAFHYIEIDQRGKTNSLSGDNGQVTRVPTPALVDVDSTIQIKVDKAKVGAAGDGQFYASDTEKLKERSARVQEAIEALGALVEQQQAAVTAYRKRSPEFQKLRRAFGADEEAFLNRLYELWPEQSPDPVIRRLRLDLEIAATNAPNAYAGVRPWLNSRVRALEAEYQALEEQTRQRAVSLRLAAWLERPGQDKVPIHLEGYDVLNEEQIQDHDRWGLDLDDQERARLKEQLEANRKVADAGNAVLRKEKSFGEAFLEAAPALSQDLANVATKVEQLRQRFATNPIPARLERVRTAAEALVARLRTDQRLSSVATNAASTLPANIVKACQAWGTEATALLQPAPTLMELSRDWQTTTAATLPGRIDGTLDALGKMLGNARSLGRSFDLDALIKDSVGEGLENAARTAIEQTLGNLRESDEAATLRAVLLSFKEDAQAVKELRDAVSPLKDVLALAQPTIDEPIYVPEVLKVPLEDLQDTAIVLRRTGRRPGDTITVKATRFQGSAESELETGSSSASLEVGQFGWYARLSPAVVLAMPERLATGNDGFRFAPTLSWMHHYMPRPEKTGAGSEVLRTLRTAAGIHAAFLTFESESNASLQVGLGATISFWDDRLQFGSGYNLMSQSRDDGRFYFFVGTDLIGLLQTVGIVK